MRSSVSKWGNSAAVRIPQPLLEQSGLLLKDEVEIEVEDHTLVIRPARSRPSYSLDSLLDGITEANLHKEVDWGGPEGNEL
ncbi:AbrB/MazE/SpoVT family DNA-binding domain-containing protein [Thiohalorhabdus methylotrophus]|uniref:AbrB/MazE/SpoVT family DNA-binding domain-containing protein n=1 Tax=Thiohalorhabdus methylotrophus TaxID=3242694 RepID=A0ABV4TXY5_9GAMM